MGESIRPFHPMNFGEAVFGILITGVEPKSPPKVQCFFALIMLPKLYSQFPFDIGDFLYSKV